MLSLYYPNKFLLYLVRKKENDMILCDQIGICVGIQPNSLQSISKKFKKKKKRKIHQSHRSTQQTTYFPNSYLPYIDKYISLHQKNIKICLNTPALVIIIILSRYQIITIMLSLWEVRSSWTLWSTNGSRSFKNSTPLLNSTTKIELNTER